MEQFFRFKTAVNGFFQQTDADPVPLLVDLMFWTGALSDFMRISPQHPVSPVATAWECLEKQVRRILDCGASEEFIVMGLARLLEIALNRQAEIGERRLMFLEMANRLAEMDTELAKKLQTQADRYSDPGFQEARLQDVQIWKARALEFTGVSFFSPSKFMA